MELTLLDFLNASDYIGPIASEEMERAYSVNVHAASLAFNGDSKIQESFNRIIENMSVTSEERAEREKRRIELQKVKEKYEAMGISGIKIQG